MHAPSVNGLADLAGYLAPRRAEQPVRPVSKEGRPLLIAPREMPFSLLHLRNLTALAEAGARIAAPIDLNGIILNDDSLSQSVRKV